MSYSVDIQQYGDRSVLVSWPEKIEQEILFDISSLKVAISDHFPHVTLVTAYASLLVSFEAKIENFVQLKQKILGLHDGKTISTLSRRVFEIPVCYEMPFGEDLHVLSTELGLSRQEIISLHSEKVYDVYFIGFLPGFMYLGGLNSRLFVPRLTTPRLRVPKGAVAIGGQQTGIYPCESPGGWHIIGRSPIDFFNPHETNPCFVNPGDQIRFYAIEQREYEWMIDHQVKPKILISND